MARTNPRHRPATQADVDRAKKQAADMAVQRSIDLTLYAIYKRHDIPPDIMQTLRTDINDTLDSLKRGLITWTDIARCLQDEIGTSGKDI